MQKNSPEPASKQAAEQLWLAYYNRELLVRGLITEAAYRHMTSKIHSRSKRSPER